MKIVALPWLAIVLIVETGLIHFFTAPHAFEHAFYLGCLFLVNFLASILAAIGIYRSQAWGWALGLAVAVTSIAGYGLSRTVGLPGDQVEEWLLLSGLLALAVESLFILLALQRPWRLAAAREIPPAAPSFLTPLTMFLMVAVIGAVIQADRPPSHPEIERLASLAELSSLEPLSAAQLEGQYGVRVAHVGVSQQDSLVGVRLEVVDPQKASALLDEYAGLIVDEETLISAPGLFVHGEFTPGQTYMMLFPNHDNSVRAGYPVSLVFDHVRVEEIVVAPSVMTP